MLHFNVWAAALLGLTLALPALAHAACPNASATVTLPADGTPATIVPVDTSTCIALAATGFGAGIPGSSLGASTKPAFTADGAGLHLAANGMALGATAAVTFTYVNGKSFVVMATVGQPVVPQATTTTP